MHCFCRYLLLSEESAPLSENSWRHPCYQHLETVLFLQSRHTKQLYNQLSSGVEDIRKVLVHNFALKTFHFSQKKLPNAIFLRKDLCKTECNEGCTQKDPRDCVFIQSYVSHNWSTILNQHMLQP